MLRPAALAFFLLTAACGTKSPAPGGAEANALGQRTYASNCQTCHGVGGAGIPGIYPPLTASPWVGGDKGRLIRLTLHGLRGPIEVKGQTYNNIMTAHGFLSDEQLAAVLTFVRANFGNAAAAVTPEEVAAVRAVTDRDGPWTAAELEAQTGIPAVPPSPTP